MSFFGLRSEGCTSPIFAFFILSRSFRTGFLSPFVLAHPLRQPRLPPHWNKPPEEQKPPNFPLHYCKSRAVTFFWLSSNSEPKPKRSAFEGAPAPLIPTKTPPPILPSLTPYRSVPSPLFPVFLCVRCFGVEWVCSCWFL